MLSTICFQKVVLDQMGSQKVTFTNYMSVLTQARSKDKTKVVTPEGWSKVKSLNIVTSYSLHGCKKVTVVLSPKKLIWNLNLCALHILNLRKQNRFDPLYSLGNKYAFENARFGSMRALFLNCYKISFQPTPWSTPSINLG